MSDVQLCPLKSQKVALNFSKPESFNSRLDELFCDEVVPVQPGNALSQVRNQGLRCGPVCLQNGTNAPFGDRFEHKGCSQNEIVRNNVGHLSIGAAYVHPLGAQDQNAGCILDSDKLLIARVRRITTSANNFERPDALPHLLSDDAVHIFLGPVGKDGNLLYFLIRLTCNCKLLQNEWYRGIPAEDDLVTNLHHLSTAGTQFRNFFRHRLFHEGEQECEKEQLNDGHYYYQNLCGPWVFAKVWLST
mmetsp:Transcript_11773/g.35905  ORF Transcript_11773/g.35905 Transcript_11773/m.35905 type:complete len:246 (-) Transcript_11773:726-1463(-)